MKILEVGYLEAVEFVSALGAAEVALERSLQLLLQTNPSNVVIKMALENYKDSIVKLREMIAEAHNFQIPLQ
ncbi:hypothetical protein PP935_gp199 [Rhizobium phage RHph_N34]|uniref:Uncharacterized protein n=2 Tax=Trinifflemingvirus TaxID=3044848 RepID=A0A7S5UWT4_9CAUD|nr:hypothetical protein PP935_gp199 [Rhizobium phage RHph_N34]YP_010661836.1 hypothetical protein PP936_gp198 [Rhizobium phage RHph_I1_9]QIG69769.1 hypothetical protein EVB81_200 [Rhizobium phage RHph_I46]QIG71050.1 hypothetical protein EVB92_200 [Rhizobium phage RHph_I9]QIG76389.1 hypothetical protein EVC25_200 [Rhizobium phage RHph_I34]QIG73635.1 hypothetical protein EVC04_198 [Rhizobium phage RHph_I1_9]QIG73974.1 hypothetical protein EVC06_199 [Rhizobium phage RHph_N34]